MKKKTHAFQRTPVQRPMQLFMPLRAQSMHLQNRTFPPQFQMAGPPPWYGGPRGQSTNPMRITLDPQNLMEFALLFSDLLETHYPLFPSDFSILKGECLAYTYLTTVFWKQITCYLPSQVHRWRGLLSQDESYPKYHPCVIQIILNLDLDLMVEWVKSQGGCCHQINIF